MRQRQTDAVFSCPAQNLAMLGVDEVGEFIRVNPIVPAGRDLLRLSAHSNLLELGHQQSAKQIGVFTAKKSLWQFGQKDFCPLSMMWAKSKRSLAGKTMWRIGFWARNVSSLVNIERWTCCRTNVESFSASNTPLRNPSLISGIRCERPVRSKTGASRRWCRAGRFPEMREWRFATRCSSGPPGR